MIFSKYFSRSEFKCECCDYDTVDAGLVVLLTEIRIYFDSPVIINSGCRCVNHNQKVGGSKNSQHLIAKAADITIANVNSVAIYNYINEIYTNTYGIGLYETFTHVDVRNKKARWSKI